MIVLNYQNSDRIEGLHPLFKTLFDYVKSHDLLRTALGRIDVMGDDLFIMNVEADAVLAEQQVLELHHQYIDVHILLEFDAGGEGLFFGWRWCFVW